MTTDTVVMARSDLAPEPQLIVEKLARLDQISADVQASFPYVQDSRPARLFFVFPSRQRCAISMRYGFATAKICCLACQSQGGV